MHSRSASRQQSSEPSAANGRHEIKRRKFAPSDLAKETTNEANMSTDLSDDSTELKEAEAPEAANEGEDAVDEANGQAAGGSAGDAEATTAAHAGEEGKTKVKAEDAVDLEEEMQPAPKSAASAVEEG